MRKLDNTLDIQMELMDLKSPVYMESVQMKDGVVYTFYYTVFKDILWKLSIAFNLYDEDSNLNQNFNIVKTVNSIEDIDKVLVAFKNFVKTLY